MSDTLRKLARDRFAVLIAKAMQADQEGRTEDKQRYMKEADGIACYVIRTYSLADFAYVTGAV